MTDTSKKITQTILTIGVIGFYLFFLVVNLFRDEIVDDAFITFRHVRNFVEGQGLVYNPGELVLGTTSPGYALLLSIPTMLFGSDSIPVISLIINLLATLLLMLCIAILAYSLFDQNYLIALIAPIIVLGSPTILLIMVSGMEVPVFIAFFAVSIVLLIYEKWIPGCLIAGLTVWIRPEGIFLVALLGITILFMAVRKHIKWQTFLTYSGVLGLPGVAYFLMLISVYHTILPHSVIAKSSGLYAYEPFSQTGPILLHIASPLTQFLNLFTSVNDPDLSLWILLFVLVPLSTFFVVIGSIELIKRNRIMWILPVFLLILVIFYSSRSTRLFVWYHGNYHIFVLVLFATGFGKILYSISDTVTKKIQLTHIAILVLLFVSLPIILTFPVQQYIQEWTQPRQGTDRAVFYNILLEEISNNIPPDAVVALPEIGYIGFYLPDNKILDLAGLVSPEIVDYFPIPMEIRNYNPTNSAIPPQAIFDLQPDVIITYDWFAIYGLYQAEWFDELYEISYSYGNLEGSEGNIDVIVRRDRLDDIIISPGSE